MQVFDKKWVGRVEGSAMKIDLYLRYMDDGKIVLCPLKGHWSWVYSGLVYCKKWEIEDEQETLVSITVKALQESMKGVASYLEFTNKTGSDYAHGCLPTLYTNLMVGSNTQIL